MVARKNKSLWHLCAFLLTLSLLAVSATVVSAQGGDDALEREAQTIDKMLMCPVCPAETIDQAQVEISFQMRAVVRELLAEGRTRQEVLDYFVDRYGADILAAPPKSGTNLVAWILPIVGVAAGLLGVFLVIRAMTRAQRSVPLPSRDALPQAQDSTGSGDATAREPQTPDDPELAPYLEIADRIIGSRRASAGRAIASLAGADSPTPSGNRSFDRLRTGSEDEVQSSSQRDDTRG